jgi:DNA-binding NarL/FixJ family response regulator
LRAVDYGHWTKDGLVIEGKVATLATRELQVLDLMCQALSNREIAAKLKIGEQTVKNYVSDLLNDLDCDNRTEVALKVTHGEIKIAKSRFPAWIPRKEDAKG